jgi:hypothetical protein
MAACQAPLDCTCPARGHSGGGARLQAAEAERTVKALLITAAIAMSAASNV